jgi:hypothetical protein
VHHSFTIAADKFQSAIDRLKKHGVELIGEEDRQGGVVNGPRVYFRDPDGTVLEFINLTSYETGQHSHYRGILYGFRTIFAAFRCELCHSLCRL